MLVRVRGELGMGSRPALGRRFLRMTETTQYPPRPSHKTVAQGGHGNARCETDPRANRLQTAMNEGEERPRRVCALPTRRTHHLPATAMAFYATSTYRSTKAPL